MFVSFKSDITGAAGGTGQLSVSRVTDYILCLVEDVRLAQSLVLRTIGFFYLSLSRFAIIVCVCPSMKFMFQAILFHLRTEQLWYFSTLCSVNKLIWLLSSEKCDGLYCLGEYLLNNKCCIKTNKCVCLPHSTVIICCVLCNLCSQTIFGQI